MHSFTCCYSHYTGTLSLGTGWSNPTAAVQEGPNTVVSAMLRKGTCIYKAY